MKTIYDIIQDRVDALKNNRRIKYRSDEEVRLNISINEDVELFSPYSEAICDVISPDISDYLDALYTAVRGYNVTGLDVYSDCLDEDEKERFETGLRNKYRIKAIENSRVERKARIAALAMCIIGVATIAISIWCYNVGFIPELVCYIVDTLGCVLMWSALDVVIFEGGEIRAERRRLKQMTGMDIKFYERNK